jgi:DNA ligase-1
MGMGIFAEFASVLETVKSTSGKNEKVRVLSEYLKGLDEADSLLVARFATGRPSEKGSADETQVGYSTIFEVIGEITGLTSKEMSKVYMKYGDLGDLACEVLEKKRETTLFASQLTIREVGEAFETISKTKGKGSSSVKKNHVKSLLLMASPLEARYVVKILTREMRIGLVDGLVEEAVARAYSLDRVAVREAHLLLGDIGLLARSARNGTIGEAKLQKLRPTNFMLAESVSTAQEIAEYFGKEVYAEYKYDGVRAQVHKAGEEVRIFSRRLEEISKSFPELCNEASSITHDFILDGEIVPFKDGKPLPFQLLQRRLRRINGFEEAASRTPVRYFCFDILLMDENELYRRTLTERREFLSRLIQGTGLLQAESKRVKTSEEVESMFRASRALGYEGLVVKDPDGPYTPGRRGKWWAKLKEELDTLDVVMVGAEYGHGKRAGVISDYTFAVRDGASLKVIGKAYSGVTDKEIDELTAKIKKITVRDHGYYREVEPTIVLEVAFDSIQQSERHDSGYALRFPRIKRIRYDKSAEEIDTIEKVKAVFSSQKVRLEER